MGLLAAFSGKGWKVVKMGVTKIVKQKSIITHHAHTPCWGDPPIFHSDHDAVQWAIGQGAFADVETAGAALAELRKRYDFGVWALWLRLVGRRLNSKTKC